MCRTALSVYAFRLFGYHARVPERLHMSVVPEIGSSEQLDSAQPELKAFEPEPQREDRRSKPSWVKSAEAAQRWRNLKTLL